MIIIIIVIIIIIIIIIIINIIIIIIIIDHNAFVLCCPFLSLTRNWSVQLKAYEFLRCQLTLTVSAL